MNIHRLHRFVFLLGLLGIAGWGLFAGQLLLLAAAAPQADFRVLLPFQMLSGTDIVIGNVQIVQATAASNPYAVYIAGRPALLRVFVQVLGPIPVSQVTASLCGYDPGGTALECLGPENGSVTAPSSEADLASTLNFNLPAAWLQPGFAFHIDLDPDNLIAGDDPANNRYPPASVRSFEFVSAPLLELEIVPINYRPFTATPGPTYVPETADLSYLTDLPANVMPVPAVVYQLHSWLNFAPESEAENLDGVSGSGWLRLLNMLTQLHLREDAAGLKHYYGLVNSFDAHGCAGGCLVGLGWQGGSGGHLTAAGWSGEGTGTTQAGETLVHELGHNYNRSHVLCTGAEEETDLHYPYPGGSIGQYGLDVAGSQLYLPDQTYDYMSYCDPSWTSDYTYFNIFLYRQGLAALAQPVQELQDTLFIGGWIGPDGQATLRPVYRQQSFVTADTQRLDRASSLRLELLGAGGRVLAAYPLHPQPIADLPGYGGFAVFVPAEADLTGLRLRAGARILAERFSSPAPAAELAPGPAALSQGPAGPVVSWGAPASQRDLFYQVRLSIDAGQTWQVLALDWPDPQLSLPPQALAGAAGSAWLEIQSTDGLHTETRTYQISNLRPDKLR